MQTKRQVRRHLPLWLSLSRYPLLICIENPHPTCLRLFTSNPLASSGTSSQPIRNCLPDLHLIHRPEYNPCQVRCHPLPGKYNDELLPMDRTLLGRIVKPKGHTHRRLATEFRNAVHLKAAKGVTGFLSHIPSSSFPQSHAHLYFQFCIGFPNKDVSCFQARSRERVPQIRIPRGINIRY